MPRNSEKDGLNRLHLSPVAGRILLQVVLPTVAKHARLHATEGGVLGQHQREVGRRTNLAREGKLSLLAKLRLFYACHLSKPKANRPIYRAICRRRALKIVELGVGDGCRAMWMISVAKMASPNESILYVGFDRFEDQIDSTSPHLTLKQAHRLLLGAGVRARLVPGDPVDSLAGVANSLGRIDLLVLSAEVESGASPRFWFFVPRLLDEGSVVLVEREGGKDGTIYEELSRPEIERLAGCRRTRLAA